MDSKEGRGATDPVAADEPSAADEPTAAGEPSGPRLTAIERLRQRLTVLITRAARYVVAIDGVLFVVVGVYALIGSTNTFQGEGFLLVVGGLALILFGFMMIIRWNLPAVRTGLIGLTAGYFASALTEFSTGRHGSMRHQLHARALCRPPAGGHTMDRLPGAADPRHAALHLHRVRALARVEDRGRSAPSTSATSCGVKLTVESPTSSSRRRNPGVSAAIEPPKAHSRSSVASRRIPSSTASGVVRR